MPAPGDETSRDQILADCLADATSRLMTAFGDRFSEQEIVRWSAESLRPYSNAQVLDFVPLFVERSAREQLLAASH